MPDESGHATGSNLRRFISVTCPITHTKGVMRGHYPMVCKHLSRPVLIGLLGYADGVDGSMVPMRALPRSSPHLQLL